MAGRVLRGSNGRFAGSTKGWRKGKGKRKGSIATQTTNRAVKTASKRVIINSAKTIANYSVGAGIVSAAASGLAANRAGLKGQVVGKIMLANGKRGLAGGAVVGAAIAAVRAPGTFRASAKASATTGLSNRAAAKLRKVNPKMTKSESYKAVYKGNSKARKAYRLLKGK